MRLKKAALAFLLSEGAIFGLAGLLALRGWPDHEFRRALFLVAAVVVGCALFGVGGAGAAGGPLRMPNSGGGTLPGPGLKVGYIAGLSVHPGGVDEAFRREREVGRFNFGYPLVVLAAAVLAIPASELIARI